MGTWFRNAGYQTAYFGKWHINFDPQDLSSNGFDIVRFATGRGDDDSLPIAVNSFLKQKHSKPFFLVLSFLNPHDVCEWSRFQVLKNGGIGTVPVVEKLPPLPNNFLPPKDESDAMSLIRKSYHKNLKLFPVADYTAFDWRRLRWGYYRLLEKVDSLIGKVLVSLDKSGLDDNSLILYTSDHGSCVGSHEFVQKTVFYDESSRVPFILKYKGVLRPSVNETLINTGVDILPTLLDFAGINKPTALPGKSVKSAAMDGKEMVAPFIVSENDMAQGGAINGKIPNVYGRMVRTARYKYCLFDFGKHREELYDMQHDPGEKANIAYKQSSRNILENMRSDLKKFAVENNDTLALSMLEFAKSEKNITVAGIKNDYAQKDN